MPKWKIHARHTPCPVKLVEVEAATEEAAVQKFVDLNVRSCREKFRDGWKAAVKVIENWVQTGGLDGLDVSLVGAAKEAGAAAKEPESVPPAEPAAAAEPVRTAVVEAEPPPAVDAGRRKPPPKRKAKVEIPAEPPGYDPGQEDDYGERPYQATV